MPKHAIPIQRQYLPAFAIRIFHLGYQMRNIFPGKAPTSVSPYSNDRYWVGILGSARIRTVTSLEIEFYGQELVFLIYL